MPYTLTLRTDYGNFVKEVPSPIWKYLVVAHFLKDGFSDGEPRLTAKTSWMEARKEADWQATSGAYDLVEFGEGSVTHPTDP